MADYCDILRGKQGNEPIAVEVLRYDTQEILAGQLNGRFNGFEFTGRPSGR